MASGMARARIGLETADAAGMTGLRLCVDARLHGDGTGVHQYTRTLLRVLESGGVSSFTLDFDASDPAMRATTPARLQRWIRALRPGARRVIPDSDRPVFRGGDFYREARAYFRIRGDLMPLRLPGPAGIMHWTFPVPLYVAGWRNIYTVHDAIPLEGPNLSTIPAGRYRRLLDRISRRADRVLTVSEAARSALVSTGRIAADLIVNAHQGVELPEGVDAPPQDGFAPQSYFLFCGRIEGRKNLDRLAEAHRSSGSARPLVIVGPTGSDGAEIRARLAAQPNVIVLGFVERARLLGLIRHARALLFPSLAEGFGLPIAEAMALGTPVLASDIAALREVAGDAALTVDPLDTRAMADGIARLCREDDLCDRLGTLGLSRATFFSHASYLERLMTIYTGVAGAVPEPIAA